MSYSELAERLRNLKPGESIEVGGQTPTSQPTETPLQPTFEPGHQTSQSPGQKTTGGMFVGPRVHEPSGLPQKLEGSEESFIPETYPSAAQPPSEVHHGLNTGVTQPRKAQPESAAGD